MILYLSDLNLNLELFLYLPRHVIPMLPEVLSNGVCSLQEGVRRWAKSVFIRFDNKGRVLGHRLRNTVICSAKRLTYLEAQALIDGNEKEARKNSVTGGEYSAQLIESLKLADQLAKKLLSRRRNDGMIELQLPEVVLEFDDDGHVADAHPEDDAFTHRIIEMFMVKANEAVAITFAGLDTPIMRRIHPEPNYGDMEELRLFARSVGISTSEEPSREDLQRLLQATRESDVSRAVHFAVLRTLSQATYSPAEIGHFALASDHYAHFTSPIRRYPDLTLHRVIAAYLHHTDNGTSVGGGKNRRKLIESIRADTRSIDEGLAAQGLGRAHHRALYFISRQPDLTVKELLRLLAITKQSLGRVLTDLVERGYIETRPGASDRRQKLLRLSPEGAALEAELFRALREKMGAAYAQAGQGSVTGFWRVLEGLIPEEDRSMVFGLRGR